MNYQVVEKKVQSVKVNAVQYGIKMTVCIVDKHKNDDRKNTTEFNTLVLIARFEESTGNATYEIILDEVVLEYGRFGDTEKLFHEAFEYYQLMMKVKRDAQANKDAKDSLKRARELFEEEE